MTPATLDEATVLPFVRLRIRVPAAGRPGTRAPDARPTAANAVSEPPVAAADAARPTDDGGLTCHNDAVRYPFLL
jgi:hypothetical protein